MPVLSDPFASLFSSTAEFARLEEGLSGPGVTALFGLPPAGRMALAAVHDPLGIQLLGWPVLNLTNPAHLP